MIVFPAMLVSAAEKAGMKVPPDPDKFDNNKYPHFDVFCKVQLARPVLRHGEHWDNAKIIAKIPNKEIKKATLEGLLKRGLIFASG